MRGRAFALLLALAPLGTAAQDLTDIDVPQATADVPGGFDAATLAFTARLQDLHPPGSAVADLEAALEADGFVGEGTGAARLTEPGFLCELTWIVRWTAKDEIIGAIEGEAGGICL